jgi:methionyl-tRNA formyltransferase
MQESQMKITLLCSDAGHPVFPKLSAWAALHSGKYEIEVVTSSKDLSGGDILFLISCHELIPPSVRGGYSKTLVIHAGDLPNGRGWSPHVWAVLEGQKHIVVTLLEAEDAVDTGAIWAKESFDLEGHELYDEINEKLFDAELKLMTFAVGAFSTIQPLPQPCNGATYYRRRKPEDSKIDIEKSIVEQLALLRVSDPGRYPAYFEKDGYIYEIVLRKRSRKN